MTRQELEKEFKDNGFQINGDQFVMEKVVADNHYIVNGIPQRRKIRMELQYIGEGSIRDVGDSDSDLNETVFHELDIIGENNEPVETLCVESFEDFVKFVG